jgi:hypothetical protein
MAKEDYEISGQDIDSVLKYLKLNDPENATPEKAIAMLEDLQAGIHMLAHSNPELLEKLYKEVKD